MINQYSRDCVDFSSFIAVIIPNFTLMAPQGLSKNTGIDVDINELGHSRAVNFNPTWGDIPSPPLGIIAAFQLLRFYISNLIELIGFN